MNGIIGMIIPPEVIGPGNAVGSQIGPVDWVIRITPGLLGAAGVLEVVVVGVEAELENNAVS